MPTNDRFWLGPGSMHASILATVGATQPRRIYPGLPIEAADNSASRPQPVAEEPSFPGVGRSVSARFGKTGEVEDREGESSNQSFTSSRSIEYLGICLI